jgi:3-dehydroquinate synthase
MQYLPNDAQVVVVSSRNVASWCAHLPANMPIIEITDDEAHKTLATIEKIVSELLRLNADRHTFLLGVGGGIVCDITGFAASMYMRGIGCGFVPTTLLAQVDASVGGKNGVNFDRYKNMLGTFRQPDFVLCDPAVFATLPHAIFIAGFSEIVKAAMIANADLFEYIEINASKALVRHPDVLEHIIFEAIKIKADIVAQDEHELGIRRKLNLGHTFAHAIEKLTAMPHGEAVSIGLCLASNMSQKMGLMQASEVARVELLLQQLGLPTRTNIAISDMLPVIFHDKKKQGNAIHVILPHGIGTCEVRKMEIMDNGQWTMDNGQWAMGNGQWTMDNGQWTMDNG